MQLLEKAKVKGVTFHNPDNGYSVLRLWDGKTSKEFTAVGHFPKLSAGEVLDLEGEWTRHQTFGDQFKAAGCRVRPPDTREAMERYLAGGLFKGVGPAQARALVRHFGLDTFRVLDLEPNRLFELPQFKGRKANNLLRQWEEHRGMREVLWFLQEHRLSTSLCGRICRHFGADAAQALRADPYRLAAEPWGVGFEKADEIGGKLGFLPDSYERVRGALLFSLGRAAEEGHVFLPREELEVRAQAMLGCRGENIVYTLDHLLHLGDAVADEHGHMHLPYLYHCEKGVARKLRELCFSPKPLSGKAVEKAVRIAEAGCGAGFTYSEEQRHGIAEAVNRGVFLLTGGPGTGKTTTVLGILRVFQEEGLSIRLAAPTGRAAKRLSEITGHPASTIHRLLKYDPGKSGFFHSESMPLDADALVVDELSMIDTVLMYALLKAVRPGTRVVFIGDPDQLPSVGPGKVLSELIASRGLAHLHLERIFRQAEASLIVRNAHRINKGRPPETETGGNFHLLERPGVDACLETVEDLVCRVLPRNHGLDPLGDLQVLTPMNQGPLGTQALNARLQARLNPSGRALRHRDREFRVGDKVMQLRNNYDKSVFNGDIGFIRSVPASGRTLVAAFEDQEAEYGGEELDQLNLAYAVTVHKSQGSEFKAVVMLLAGAHHVMLQRNLLYTGVTRARDRLFLVGQKAALLRAVANNPAVLRNTRLAERLKEEMAYILRPDEGGPAALSADGIPAPPNMP